MIIGNFIGIGGHYSKSKISVVNKKHILDLVGKNRLEAAINEIKQNSDADLHRTIIQIEGRYNELKNKINHGLLTNQEQELERNKIAKSLIDLASGRPPTEFKNKGEGVLTNRNKIVVFSILLLSILAFTLLMANKTLQFAASSGTSYLIYVLCGLLAAYTCFGLLSSFGEINGQKYGLNIRLGGAIVAMMIVTFGGGYYEKNMQASPSLDMRIRFVSDNNQMPQKISGKLSLFLGNEEKSQILDEESSVLFQGISNKWRGEKLSIALESSKFEFDSLSLNEAKITDEKTIVLKVKFARKYVFPEEVAFDIFYKEGHTVTFAPKENTKILSMVFDVHSHSDYIIPLDKKAELMLFSGCHKGLIEFTRNDYVYLQPREFDQLLFECEISDEVAADLFCSIGSFHLKYHPLVAKSDSVWSCNVFFNQDNLNEM